MKKTCTAENTEIENVETTQAATTMTKNEVLAFAKQTSEELMKTMETEYSEKMDYVDLFLLRQDEYRERLAEILNSKGIETKIQSGFVYIVFENEQIAVG